MRRTLRSPFRQGTTSVIHMLEVIDSATQGGAEHLTRIQTKHFARRGYHLTLVSPPGSYHERFRTLSQEGVRVETYNIKRPDVVRTILHFRRMIRQDAVTIVHSHGYVADFCIALATLGMPSVYHMTTIHALLIGLPVHGLLKRLQIFIFSFVAYHRASAIFAVSDEVKRIVERHYLLPRAKVIAVMNSVDPEELDGPKSVDQLRAELGIEPADTVILSVGILYEYKGHQYLIEALGTLLRDLPLKCFILGRDSGYGHRLRELIDRYGLASRVILAGHRNDINRFYAAASMLVLPTLVDALPNVILEAMYLGVPVITTSLSTNLVAVRHGETGLAVAPHNSLEIAQAIKRLLDNPSEARHMARNAQRFIAQHCTIGHMIDSMIMHVPPPFRPAHA